MLNETIFLLIFNRNQFSISNFTLNSFNLNDQSLTEIQRKWQVIIERCSVWFHCLPPEKDLILSQASPKTAAGGIKIMSNFTGSFCENNFIK